MPWGVQEGDGLLAWRGNYRQQRWRHQCMQAGRHISRTLKGANVLRNAASFPRRDGAGAKRVQQRRLAMV